VRVRIVEPVFCFPPPRPPYLVYLYIVRINGALAPRGRFDPCLPVPYAGILCLKFFLAPFFYYLFNSEG